MPVNEDFENDSQEAGQRSTRGFLTILWQRKALVILPALLGLLGGLLLYWKRAPVYQSTTQILVIKKRSDAALPIAGGDPRVTYVDDYMATHLHLLRSPVIIERAVKKKDLAAMKMFENGGDPVGMILSSLTVGRDKEGAGSINNIVHLTFRGPVPDECGKVLAAVVECYQEFLDITYRNVSDQTLDLITKARDVLRKDLAASEEKFEKFRQQTPMLWKTTKDGSNVQLDRVANLESKRSTLLVRQAELRERVKFLEEAIAAGKGVEVLQAVARTVDGKPFNPDKALDDQLLPLLLQEQQLLETYGEKHPQVLSVRNRISLIREHYFKSAGDAGKPGNGPLERPLQITREELRETDLFLNALVKALDELKNETKELTNLQIQEDHLRKDVARTEQLLDGTIKRLAEINLVRDSGGFDARTLCPAGSGVKVAPSALQNIAGGLFIGILAGFGLAFLADFSDRSFRHPDEVRSRLGLHILGHIPFLKPDGEISDKVTAGQIAVDPLLYPLHKPKSLEAEAYRAVRTALYFSSPVEGHPVLQVSSPAKGDGKSLMVSNLALSMAQSGKKVLVIDADCRRPRMHKIFNLPNEQGLTTVIAQQVEWKDAIQPSPVEGLWLMPSGPIPPNPAELLSSPHFRGLLEAVRSHYDYVIVDTPPLLAVTDPCIVAGHVDGLVLVLRLTRQGRPHAERACEILKSLRVKVLGVVVNGVARQVGSGIYNAEHYDYTESYEQGDNADKYDGDYYEDEEADDEPRSGPEGEMRVPNPEANGVAVGS